MNKEHISEKLLEWALSEGNGSERLNPLDFGSNDHYKVCYRFMGNMLQRWKELGFRYFPEEEEAMEIALLVHPYFVWLVDNGMMWQLINVYEFHEDVWRDME